MPAPASAPLVAPAPAAVTLVFGASDRERDAYAAGLAHSYAMEIATTPPRELPRFVDRLAEEAVDDRQPGVPRAVVSVPRDVDATDLLPARPAARACVALVVVVDAPRIVTDLGDETYVDRLDHGRPVVVAQAAVTVQHLELAELIVVRRSLMLRAAPLARLLALLAHLNPTAEIVIAPDAAPASGFHSSTSSPRTTVRSAARLEPGERAGWVHVLNGESQPRFTHAAVQALRYEHARPLHPGRLCDLLAGDLATDRYGTLVRSAGFCRLATRSDRLALWSHVGRMISFEPLAADDECGELGAVGQEIAILGVGLDRAGLTAALDACALTDEEFLAGPDAWRRLPDELPAWIS